MEAERLNVNARRRNRRQARRDGRAQACQRGNSGTGDASSLVDESEPDAANIVRLLGGIDGAWERIEVGFQAADEGDTIPLAGL